MTNSKDQFSMKSLLREMVTKGASDLYITVDFPPSLRVNDEIIAYGHKTLTESDVLALTEELLDEAQKHEFQKHLELNFSLTFPDGSRFRFNFFRQLHKTGFVVRRINTQIPTIKELGLPEIYAKLVMRKNGLIILASPSGSGKSTSMAAMVDHRNIHGNGHIVTIEDPIEFIHTHNKSIVTQREVGSDTTSFANALKNALRQKADVIVLGETRDRDAMEHALRFAETGHLCLTTIHANNTMQAVDRIKNMFPDATKQHVLMTLSQCLIAIFTQKLITDVHGNRIVATENLLNEGLMRTLIAEGRIEEIHETIEKNKDVGMMTMDQSLLNLFYAQKIDHDTLVAEAENPSHINLELNKRAENIQSRVLKQ